jgi:hypothetical protein
MEIGLPNEKGRFQILNIHTCRMREYKKINPDVDIKVRQIYFMLPVRELHIIIQIQMKCTLVKVFNCILFTSACFGHCCGHLQGVS